jgi:hypothetical protein
MKTLKPFFISSILVGGLLFTACGEAETSDSKTTEPTSEQKSVQPEDCTYKLHKDSVKVGWTAYKFTNKVGVKGTFEQFTYLSESEAKSLADIVETASISIPVESLETLDEGRNLKIRNFFFGTLENTEVLKGKVISVDRDNPGNGEMLLIMNNQEVTMPFTYALSDEGELIVKAGIDVNNWNAQAGIASLNEECKLLHTGEDGVSKLWPNVDIAITTYVEKDCK